MLILSFLSKTNNMKKQRIKINIMPYGKNFY